MRNKIAIVHPRMGFGGSEARVIWSIEALRGDNDITLITTGETDIGRLSAYHAAYIEPAEIELDQIPLPWPLDRSSRFAALRGHLIQRHCQKVADHYDLMISAYNPTEFGVPGIQFLADFSFDDELRTVLDPPKGAMQRLVHGQSPARAVYKGLCELISPTGPQYWSNHLFVANSCWSADVMEDRYGIQAEVVYPPVSLDFDPPSVEGMENAFVTISRISPEKRIIELIKILREVRDRGHDIAFHIVGGPDDPTYFEQVSEVAEEAGEWVTLHGRLQGVEKIRMLARCRYGISGRPREPFGIAVAEMVKAGCVTFVPNGGGQVEIVDHESLTYEDHQAAVKKICHVLDESALETKLREHLSHRADRFSVDTFQQELVRLVEVFLRQNSE